MQVTYEEILSEEIRKEIDTDHGILRAYWETLKRLIELKDRKEAMRFAQEFGKQWGLFKMNEALGDIKDAGI